MPRKPKLRPRIPQDEKRVVVWFSCGATSAVALKMALDKYGRNRVVAVYTDPGSEHEDNLRFLHDVEDWLGIKVLILKSAKYKDTWDCWEKRKYINGSDGAPCTLFLKKTLRHEFENPWGDIQIFGFTFDELDRIDRFNENHEELVNLNGLDMLLADKQVGRDMCHALLLECGLKLPYMYGKGYDHSNCPGCPKGGKGYWAAIRIDFPEIFERMAKLERLIGATCIHIKGEPFYLDQLPLSQRPQRRGESLACDIYCNGWLEKNKS